MADRTITKNNIDLFSKYLIDMEKSDATVEKYRHDVAYFSDFVQNKDITKDLTKQYKKHLEENYALSSANSMIAALNSFFHFMGWEEVLLRRFKVQKSVFIPEERELNREEYHRLVREAEKRGNQRLCLILQTICTTGIRISELPFITVESVLRGEAQVNCKGKSRRVFLLPELKKKLLVYTKKEGIASGPIFITKKGKPINRCCVWREMKGLCKKAGVSPGKVFPHNLRHLFARTFYKIEKDIVLLADVLGHSSINTTRIYTAASAMTHRRRMEKLHLIL